MNTIKLFGMTALLSFSLVACGGGAEGDLKKLKDEACACKDKACAEAVNKKIDKAMDEMEKKIKDEKEAEKLLPIALEAAACLAKHGAGGMGGGDEAPKGDTKGESK